MLKTTRTRLKKYFLTGHKPTQEQFAQLIDASLNLNDDGLIIHYDTQGHRQVDVQANLTVSHDVSLQGSVHIKGDLYIDGDCLFADGQPIAPSIAVKPILNAAPAGLPLGSIILWQGQHLPARWQYCDGQQGRPQLSAPAVSSSAQALYYIIHE